MLVGSTRRTSIVYRRLQVGRVCDKLHVFRAQCEDMPATGTGTAGRFPGSPLCAPVPSMAHCITVQECLPQHQTPQRACHGTPVLMFPRSATIVNAKTPFFYLLYDGRLLLTVHVKLYSALLYCDKIYSTHTCALSWSRSR